MNNIAIDNYTHHDKDIEIILEYISVSFNNDIIKDFYKDIELNKILKKYFVRYLIIFHLT